MVHHFFPFGGISAFAHCVGFHPWGKIADKSDVQKEKRTQPGNPSVISGGGQGMGF